MNAGFELADAIQRFGYQLSKKEKLNSVQLKTLNNIRSCRTSEMGGHEEVCDCCGNRRFSYNSCGDRHCPKCLAAKQARWIDELMQKTLSVRHFHIIFTTPHCINNICLHDKRAFYNTLFSAVWRTLHSFGYSKFGVETGAIAVLHSWGQNLSLHPHIHCIVPAVGYSLKGEWKNIGTSENYLYPVHQLSASFKGKFLDSIKRLLKKSGVLHGFNQSIQEAWKKKWVVYCEASMSKPEHVIRYLGQYTHRVAISNQRILHISDSHVTFIAKDYRDSGRKKTVKLEGTEFLRRFCQHILPSRFVKIRRYGIYNETTKRNLEIQFSPVEKTDTANAHSENPQERMKRLTGFDIFQCPVCKKGKMMVVREIPRIRSPDFDYKTHLQTQ